MTKLNPKTRLEDNIHVAKDKVQANKALSLLIVKLYTVPIKTKYNAG